MNYGTYFLRYRDWFKEEGHWPSAQITIQEYGGMDAPRERFRHVDVLKEYIKFKGTGTSDKRNTWYAVRSFYAFHRLPLLRIPRNVVSRLFKLSGKDERRSLELTPLMVENIRNIIFNSSQPYRAVFMVMFQSAMGLAEFMFFNRGEWRRVVEGLDQPGPLRIDLHRGKTSRTRFSRYYTFIGQDGKKLIKEWLAVRPQVESDALFVLFNKNRRVGVLSDLDA